VIAMIDFVPHDVTREAKAIAQKYRAERRPEGGEHFGRITPRVPLPESIDPSRGRKAVKLKVHDVEEIAFGTEEIDLSAVEQIVHPSQVRAIALALVYAKRRHIDGRRTLPQILDAVMQDIEQQGLDVLSPTPRGDLAEFRRYELAAALNRLRTLEVRQSE
jgi:predicted ABC-class ATPase